MGLTLSGYVGKREERRWKMGYISCWGSQECNPRESVESWERWLCYFVLVREGED